MYIYIYIYTYIHIQEDDVWVVGSMFDAVSNRACVGIFDGNDVSKGMYLHVYLYFNRNMYEFIYIHMYIYVCIYIYKFIHIHI
jgi:hypothetical protein